MVPDGPTRQGKATGRHYTPAALARFLADLALEQFPRGGPRSVLDPACGDGSLLAALLERLPPGEHGQLRLTGFELDRPALDSARARLRSHRPDPTPTLQLVQGDFLASCDPAGSPGRRPFDLILANPPYVRTQVLGSGRAKELARAHGLSGRVDLYQAFVQRMSRLLADDGVLALLCSNRFMTTRSGAAMRSILAAEFRLHRIIDLGDTRLFPAAVLPAIVIASRGRPPAGSTARFVRIERASTLGQDRPEQHASLLEALASGARGSIRVGQSGFRIVRGTFRPGSDGRTTWSLLSDRERAWIEQVERRTARRFAEVVHIRVGIKSTADQVFVRQDWDALPADRRPEQRLLRPLLDRSVAAAYRASAAPRLRVLYPHQVEAGLRRAVPLEDHPHARAYLEQHRRRLAGRRYVTEAKRNWYELWVPHDPDGWAQTKIVTPDISDRPRFFLDESGAVVQGNCYWMTLRPGHSRTDLLLILAVANSSLALRYYDLVCANRLYSGRRRFITQYLNRFPLPDPGTATARWICLLVEQRLCLEPGNALEAERLERKLDDLVSRAFLADAVEDEAERALT